MVSNKYSENKPFKKSTANKRHSHKQSTSMELQRQQICDTAARIIYEDGIRDYHKAKLRACETLHLKSNTPLPTNEEIEHAVHRRIALFETRNQSPDTSQKQLSTATDILTILSDFQPRVTQSLATSSKLKNCPMEVHAFSDSAQLLEEELKWRGIDSFMIEKRYRYSNDQYVNVPLIICQLDDCDIEVSVFKEKELHRSPVCPTNGRVYQRISLKQLHNLETSTPGLTN